MTLSPAARAKLEGVHPDLVRVVLKAAEDKSVQFTVTEGARSIERQKEMVAKGASQTMRSRHVVDAAGVAHAVDLAVVVGGKITWQWSWYAQLARVMKAAAAELGVPIEWGGDWTTLKDGPHFQLPWVQYPGAPAQR